MSIIITDYSLCLMSVCIMILIFYVLIFNRISIVGLREFMNNICLWFSGLLKECFKINSLSISVYIDSSRIFYGFL